MTNSDDSKVVFSLFPVPMIKFKFGKQLTVKELNFVHEQPTHRNEGNLISDDFYVLKNKKLFDVRVFIENCLEQYVDEVYLPIEKFKLGITQSWLNYTSPSEYHHTHKHSNSVVSGVFYINADKETDKIYFFSPRPDTWTIPATKYNTFNSNSWWFKVETGDLVLFPSFVPHKVETVVGDKRRISLAFNTFIVGSVGTPDMPDRLTISGVA